MQSYNPYAPPTDDPGFSRPARASGCWREGDTAVVCRPDAELPDRCVRCNEPAQGYRLLRKLHWHHPGLYVAAAISPLIYVVVAMMVRKTTTVRVGLCQRHRERRRNGMLIGWIGSLVSVAACSAGLAADTPEALLPGFLFFMGFMIAGIVMSQVVQPKKIDNNLAWLKVGKPFLESLDVAKS